MPKKTIWLLTLLAGLCGGAIPAFSKISLETMNSGTLTILRYVYTFVALVAIAYLGRKPVNWRQVVRVLPVSVLAAANAICFAIGIKYVQASSVQLLYTIVPVLVVLISWAYLREKTTPSKLIGVLIGLGGVLVVTLAPIISGGGHLSFHPLGTAMIFVGTIAYSFYTVLAKPAQQRATPSDILLGTAVATLVCQVGYSLMTSSTITLSGISLRSLLASLMVGLVGTALFYWLYQYIVKASSPLTASVITYVQPVFGALWAGVVIGDHILPLAILGGAITLCGVGQVNGVWRSLYKRVRRSSQNPSIPTT